MVPTVKAHWRTQYQHHLPQNPSQALPVTEMPWLTSCGCHAGNGLSHVHFLCVLCSAAVRLILTIVPSCGLLWIHELHTVWATCRSSMQPSAWHAVSCNTAPRT